MVTPSDVKPVNWEPYRRFWRIIFYYGPLPGGKPLDAMFAGEFMAVRIFWRFFLAAPSSPIPKDQNGKVKSIDDMEAGETGWVCSDCQNGCSEGCSCWCHGKKEGEDQGVLSP